MAIEGTLRPLRSPGELIRRCQAGHQPSYEPLVREYTPDARRVALGILRDPDAAEDAVQEAFIKAYRGLKGFDATRDFRPWFLRIVRNQCRDMLRRGRAGPGLERITPRLEEGVGEDGEDGERGRARRAAHDLLWAGLGRISLDHREVLVLKELEGLGYREIAEATGIPEGTVASRLYHARRALRVALAGMGVQYP